MQIFIRQKSLCKRAERNNTKSELWCCFFQSVLFDRPVENGIFILIDNERAVHLGQ